MDPIDIKDIYPPILVDIVEVGNDIVVKLSDNTEIRYNAVQFKYNYSFIDQGNTLATSSSPLIDVYYPTTDGVVPYTINGTFRLVFRVTDPDTNIQSLRIRIDDGLWNAVAQTERSKFHSILIPSLSIGPHWADIEVIDSKSMTTTKRVNWRQLGSD